MQTNRPILVLTALLLGALLVGAGPALAQSTTNQTAGTGTITANPATAAGTTGGATTGGATTGGATTVAETTTEAGGVSITFDDQTVTDGRVSVSSATLPDGGFVVIADSPPQNDSYGNVRGVSYALSPGTTDDITIQLDSQLNGSEGNSFVAVAHTDSNDNDEFDFQSAQGQQDTPYSSGGNLALELASVSPPTTGAAPETTGAGAAETTTTETTTTTAASTASDRTVGAAPTSGAETTEPAGTPAESTTSDSGPGFGSVVALVALLAVATVLLGRRRND